MKADLMCSVLEDMKGHAHAEALLQPDDALDFEAIRVKLRAAESLLKEAKNVIRVGLGTKDLQMAVAYYENAGEGMGRRD